MKILQIFIAITLGLVLQACTNIHDVSELKEGTRYSVGQTANAKVWDVILDRYRYLAAPTVTIESAIPSANILAGEELTARTVDGERAYCTPIASSFTCLFDSHDAGAFDQVLVNNLGITRSKETLPIAARYNKTEGRAKAGSKSELVYVGMTEDTIHVLFRDYKNDLVTPDYTQDLLFKLASKGPTEISYRTARIKVLQADDQGIQYQILSNLAGG